MIDKMKLRKYLIKSLVDFQNRPDWNALFYPSVNDRMTIFKAHSKIAGRFSGIVAK
jgi:hypothetical protein